MSEELRNAINIGEVTQEQFEAMTDHEKRLLYFVQVMRGGMALMTWNAWRKDEYERGTNR